MATVHSNCRVGELHREFAHRLPGDDSVWSHTGQQWGSGRRRRLREHVKHRWIGPVNAYAHTLQLPKPAGCGPDTSLGIDATSKPSRIAWLAEHVENRPRGFGRQEQGRARHPQRPLPLSPRGFQRIFVPNPAAR
jgi:hypothetical protein